MFVSTCMLNINSTFAPLLLETALQLRVVHTTPSVVLKLVVLPAFSDLDVIHHHILFLTAM